MRNHIEINTKRRAIGGPIELELRRRRTATPASRAVDVDSPVVASILANIATSTDTWVVYSARRGPDGAIVDLVVEYANDAYWAFTTTDREVVTGRGVRELNPGLQWKGSLEAMRRAIETGEPSTEHDVRQTRQLGPNKGQSYQGTIVMQPIGDYVAVAFKDATDILEAKAAAQLAASRFEAIFESTPIAMHVFDLASGEVRANHAAVALFGFTTEDLVSESLVFGPGTGAWMTPAAREIFAASYRKVIVGETIHLDELGLPTKDGHRVIVSCDVAPALAPSGDVAAAVACFVDLTATRRLTSERNQLAAAIEQAAESIEIMNLAGRVSYVNPAFERITGYSRDEVIGENLSILKSGVEPPSFYKAMWSTLRRGRPWVADFVNRRKDGSLVTQATTITPIRDADGTHVGYVSVKRDVTHERELEQRSARLLRERALIADTIRGLRAGDSTEATAQSICRQVLSLRDMTAAQIFIFELDGRAVPLGFVVAGRPDPELRRLPAQRSRYLRERAAQGPWIEPWEVRPSHPYNRELTDLGTHVVGYAPVRHDGRVIGLLVVDADPTVDEARMAEDLPAFVEFADVTGAIIGRAVAERTEVGRVRDRIATVISKRAFRPVFQPIVELDGRAFVGYEALTRFNDGVAPNVRFEEAAAVGISLELELATLREAIDAARALPPAAWLNLNVSPELILAGGELRTLLQDLDRAVVLEVTEHAAIADYVAFRAAVAALGPNVQLAVDDAGAGYSSMRHILELRPAFVKLDRSMVMGLEADEARRAMVAGLEQFARSTGSRLIPEGIETQAELDALRSLGIGLGQGFLLARPEPAPAG